MCGTIPPFSYTSSRRYELGQEKFTLTVENSVQFLNLCCGFSDCRSETLAAECFHLSACLVNEFIWIKSRYSLSLALNPILGTNCRTAATGVTKRRLPWDVRSSRRGVPEELVLDLAEFLSYPAWRQNDCSKHRELLAQRHDVTSQCVWNLMCYLLRVWQKACIDNGDDWSVIITASDVSISNLGLQIVNLSIFQVNARYYKMQYCPSAQDKKPKKRGKKYTYVYCYPRHRRMVIGQVPVSAAWLQRNNHNAYILGESVGIRAGLDGVGLWKFTFFNRNWAPSP